MTTLTHLNLPDRQESELAQRGQRELAAYLSTRLETQRIAIVGEDDKAHTIELTYKCADIADGDIGGVG